MSAPSRSEDGTDDPLRHPKRQARRPASVEDERAFAHAPPTAPGTAPAMAPGIGGPNIAPPPSRQRPFEGDVAIKDLRHRLALDPDLIPRPPMRLPRRRALPWIGRLLFVLIVAAAVAFAVTLVTRPPEPRNEPGGTGGTGGIGGAVAPLLERLSRPAASVQPARLVVESQRAFANEPLALGVSLSDAAGDESLTVVGLANGTTLSAGQPLGASGWQVPARDLGKAFAYAPKDFVGIMDAAVDLRSARDRLMDSRLLRLEWMPKQESRLAPPLPQLDQSKLAPIIHALAPEEIAMLMTRGEDFLKNGDIAAARLLLRRAAYAGNARAALTLGATFDPAFLAEQGVLGLAGDVAQARVWYERAAELGSREALHRLERLTGK
jgi:hypothetical protein